MYPSLYLFKVLHSSFRCTQTYTTKLVRENCAQKKNMKSTRLKKRQKKNCRHCKSRYVGRTLQRLEERVKQHVPRHLVSQTEGTEKKRGLPPKERKSAGEYQSAIADWYLAANALCRARYSDLDFRILARARSEQHFKVLETLYIQSLKPVLCRQKQFVTDLKLFHRPSN